MSNLSDIGFPVKSEEDVNQVLMDVLSHIEQVPCPPYGFYYRFTDASGAELFLQANPDQDLIGFNPAFNGRSDVEVNIARLIERDTSELDGAMVARTGSGAFVFDVPDFRAVSALKLPSRARVCLNAFASNDLEHQSSGSMNDLPSPGLHPLRDRIQDLLEPDAESHPPQAHVRIAGRIVKSEMRENVLTGNRFWYFLLDTGEAEVDVVADPALLKQEPLEGDSLEGSFWLSGKLIEWSD